MLKCQGPRPTNLKQSPFILLSEHGSSLSKIKLICCSQGLSSLQSKLRYNCEAKLIQSRALRGEVWATVINPRRGRGGCVCIGGWTRWARSFADPRLPSHEDSCLVNTENLFQMGRSPHTTLCHNHKRTKHTKMSKWHWFANKSH